MVSVLYSLKDDDAQSLPLVLHGYSALLTGASLQYVLTSSDVEYVEADGSHDVDIGNCSTDK